MIVIMFVYDFVIYVFWIHVLDPFQEQSLAA